MSITRKLLKGMGLTDEQQDTILEAHTTTLEDIKAERDKYKAAYEKLPEVQKQLDELKAAGDGGYKDKYEKEHEAFESYKSEVTAKETRAAKEKAERSLLKQAGIPDKYHEILLKSCDLDEIEFNDKGEVKNAEKIVKGHQEKFGDFVAINTEKGADVSTPPAATGKYAGKTKEEIINIKDTAERQRAIAENPELFGIRKE